MVTSAHHSSMTARAVTVFSCNPFTIASCSAAGALLHRSVMKQPFLEELRTQRWDDHRYYHHSRINQSLHLVSAISFVVAYGLLFVDPAMAAILAWCVSMTTRQAGHFFFEPRGYDHVNQASDEFKEDIKVGYNIRRKIVLMAVWVLIPLVLWLSPSVLGATRPAVGFDGWLHDVGIAWLALGVAGLVCRVLQLWVQQDLTTGLVWMTKILTDPFHDIWLYHKAPLHLLRGELIDPMAHVRRR
jgi:hypothetical protein